MTDVKCPYCQTGTMYRNRDDSVVVGGARMYICDECAASGPEKPTWREALAAVKALGDVVEKLGHFNRDIAALRRFCDERKIGSPGEWYTDIVIRYAEGLERRLKLSNRRREELEEAIEGKRSLLDRIALLLEGREK